METEEEKNNNNKNTVVTVLVLVGVYVFFVINTSLNKNKALPSPTTRQKIEEISVEEKAEADRKAEEEKKKKEEEQKNEQAGKYCSERKNNYRKHAVVEESLIKTDDDGMHISFADAKQKIGNKLTKEDCRKIVDFMYKWRIEKIDEVATRDVWFGMSKTELYLAVGLSDDINTSNYGYGEREQLIYHKDSYGFDNIYFYTEDGKLTSYQNF